MSSSVIVDAGPLYAYVDADEAHHQRCAKFLATHGGALIIPQLLITEVAYLLASRLGTRAEMPFLADVAAGFFSDWLRITELIGQYRDFPLGTVDASIVTCAERRRPGRRQNSGVAQLPAHRVRRNPSKTR